MSNAASILTSEEQLPISLASAGDVSLSAVMREVQFAAAQLQAVFVGLRAIQSDLVSLRESVVDLLVADPMSEEETDEECEDESKQ